MNTERKPVDVLAVMNEATFTLGLPDNNTPNDAFTLDDLREARAAVAELIAASELVLTKPDMTTVRGRQEMSRRLRVLSAARARVGGA